MEHIAVFPGSFDPVTIGHESIVKRALQLFDKIIIGVGDNPEKPGYFPLKKRVEWLEKVFEKEEKVEVQTYKGLTVNFCIKNDAKYILRGLRTSSDFEYERAIAQTNKALSPGIDSIFLLTTPELTGINSTLIRDVIKNGGDAGIFVPKAVNLEEGAPE